MRGLFTLSYALLWGLVVLEALLLREILRKTVWFKRFYVDFSRRAEGEELSWLRTGTVAPDFTARMLGTGESFNTSHLKGRPSILLFVSPESASPFYKGLALAIHGMWHKVEGHLYLVCSGSEAACRQFVREHPVEGFTEDQVPVVLDEGGRAAESFLISRTPQAVELDENLLVKRYGRPEAGEHSTQGGADGGQTEHTGDPQLVTINDSRSVVENAGEEVSTSEIKRSASGGDEKPCDWPDEQPSTGASFARVDTTVSCVMTRFRLRSAWSLIPFYLAFRRVRRSARDVAGLLKATFLVEDLRTCYTVSFWKDECAIVDFGRVHAHITAANSAFGPTWRKDLKRPEIWSAQFRLWAVSAHNLNWEGFDLQTVLADQWGRREMVARWGFFEEEGVAHDG